MNFFSTNVFLESLAEVHFRDRRWEICDYQLGNEIYRLLSVDEKPIADWPFLDFLEARAPSEPPDGKPRPLSFLPHASVGRVKAVGERPASIVQGQQPAPFVDWTQIPTWEAFQKHVRERRSNLFADTAKRERKLEAAIGPISFRYHDPTDEVFDLCRAWKSAQFIATGGTDYFFQDNLPVFQGLRRREALVMHSLRAGERLVAITWSAFSESRLSYWVQAYDPECKAYSPGRILLHRTMQESQRLGHGEFDLLIGDEEYKWHYASDTRVIASVGTPPLKQRLKKVIKIQVKKALERYPKALAVAKDLKKRWAG
jgi:hypothetical protein